MNHMTNIKMQFCWSCQCCFYIVSYLVLAHTYNKSGTIMPHTARFNSCAMHTLHQQFLYTWCSVQCPIHLWHCLCPDDAHIYAHFCLEVQLTLTVFKKDFQSWEVAIPHRMVNCIHSFLQWDIHTLIHYNYTITIDTIQYVIRIHNMTTVLNVHASHGSEERIPQSGWPGNEASRNIVK